MPGPRPEPTKLRVLRGNPGKRPLPAIEPQPEAKLPQAPRHLSDEAKREWRRIGRELEQLGLVASIDRALLTAYCSAWGRLVEAEEMLRRYGSVVKTPNGMLVQSPYLQIVNKSIEQLSRIAPEFGLSPSSRTKVTPAARPAHTEEAKWRDLL